MSDNTNLAYYRTLFAQEPTSAFDAWVKTQTQNGWFGDLVQNVEDNPNFVVERFQSAIDCTTTDYTIEELIQAAPLQQQNDLAMNRISAIWLDKETGLANTGIMFRLPEVFVLPDGTIRLVGGNHRLASIIYGLMLGDADESTILNTSIRVMQYQADREVIGELLAITEDGQKIYPTSKEVDAVVHTVIYKSWVASNQSRTMKGSEVSNARLYEKGIDRNDLDSVMTHAFPSKGEAKILRLPDAFRLVSSIIFNSEFLEDSSDAGRSKPEFSVDKMAANVIIPCLSGEPLSMRKKVFEDILKSFWTRFSAHHVVESYKTRSGTDKERKVKVYSREQKEADLFLDVVRNIFKFEEQKNETTSLFESAIEHTMSNLSEDSEYKTNVARQASEVGRVLFEEYCETYEPAGKPEVRKATTPKRVTGLGLAL